MAEFVAGKGTTALGIIGTVLGSLGVAGNGGTGLPLLGMGSKPVCSEDHTVNRYEAAQQAKIAELETEIKLRDANTFTMGEMGKLRDYVDSRFSSIEKSICDEKLAQAVVNANLNAAVVTLNGQVAQTAATLAGITRTAVPQSAICNFGCGCCNS